MSGGHFDYAQYRLVQIAEDIRYVVDNNFREIPKEEHNPWDYDQNGNLREYAKYYYSFPPEIIARMKEGYNLMRKAYIYAQRIDWLLSGDDGEKDFLRRLEEDLKEFDFESGEQDNEQKNEQI